MINHIQAYPVANSGLFDNLNSYDDFNEAIEAYGKNGKNGNEKERLGAAFEVFSEFFLARFGPDPHIGVNELKGTSSNKFEVGADFRFKDALGRDGIVQCKYRSNHFHQFKEAELAAAVLEAFRKHVQMPSGLVLFTNLLTVDPFHFSYPRGKEEFRYFGRSMQESFILRDPAFWTDFGAEMHISKLLPVCSVAPTMRKHQQDAFDECEKILDSNEEHRGKPIMTCGAGKTLVQYNLIRRSFKHRGHKIQIIVAPTIALIQQHEETYSGYGLFLNDGIRRINWRTGDDYKAESITESVKTTSPSDLKGALELWKGDQVLILSTYASIENLLTSLKNLGFAPDVTVYDEFHNLVSQAQSRYDWLLALPGKNLFFSASEKYGNIVSSANEALFGRKLIDVDYQTLRDIGILVPKINIKVIRESDIATASARLAPAMKQNAARNGFDLKVAYEEAAVNIIAMNDLVKSGDYSNILVFSQSIPVCIFLAGNELFEAELPKDTLVVSVSAATPQLVRKQTFDKIKASNQSMCLQHSVVKEGIDITAFNAIVIHRGMNAIALQQGLGRAIRANPIDTKKLESGEISLDSPDGWLKYSATVYLAVDDDNKAYLEDLLEKLSAAGLTVGDIQWQDITEERCGVSPEDTSWMSPIEDNPEFTRETLQEQMERYEIERKHRAAVEALSRVPDEEFFGNVFN
jgi:superfamily II DNA or RNA helicase